MDPLMELMGKELIIREWLSFQHATLDEVRRRFPVEGATFRSDAPYLRMSGLTLFHPRDAYPGFFYFDKAGKLAMLYIEDGDEVHEVDEDDLIAFFGAPVVRLASRAGKMPHYVWPEQGFAASLKGDVIRFLEVFPPMTEEAYLNTIYIEPGPFIK